MRSPLEPSLVCAGHGLGGSAAGGLSLLGTPPREADQHLPWHRVPFLEEAELDELPSSSSLPGLLNHAGVNAGVGEPRDFLGDTLEQTDLKDGGPRGKWVRGRAWWSRG